MAVEAAHNKVCDTRCMFQNLSRKSSFSIFERDLEEGNDGGDVQPWLSEEEFPQKHRLKMLNCGCIQQSFELGEKSLDVIICHGGIVLSELFQLVELPHLVLCSFSLHSESIFLFLACNSSVFAVAVALNAMDVSSSMNFI